MQGQTETQLAEVKVEKQNVKPSSVKTSNPVPASINEESAIEPKIQTRTEEVQPIYEDVMVATAEMSVEEYLSEPEAVFAAAPAMAERPDGIYTGSTAVTFSQPASAQPQVFDLLTSTF